VALHDERLELVVSPPLVDLADIRTSVGALRVLERRLRGERGPRGYRGSARSSLDANMMVDI